MTSRLKRGLVLTLGLLVLLAVGTVSGAAAVGDGTGPDSAALGTAELGAEDVAHTVADPSSGAAAQVDNSTIFERIETESSGLVIELNMSMLTSGFQQDSVFRLVVGGTASDSRVVWFDIGIGYRGGPVLSDPTDQFVVRSAMSLSFPGF